MGYTTRFSGKFELNGYLTRAQREYLLAFSDTRRMKRDNAKCFGMADPKRVAVNLPLGTEGEYFVGGLNYTWGTDISIVDENSPPSTQPGLWCQWVPTKNGGAIEWNGGEKFYDYVEWLEYLIKNFLEPWGYELNGSIQWGGDSKDDVGLIIVTDNKVVTKSLKQPEPTPKLSNRFELLNKDEIGVLLDHTRSLTLSKEDIKILKGLYAKK